MLSSGTRCAARQKQLPLGGKVRMVYPGVGIVNVHLYEAEL